MRVYVDDGGFFCKQVLNNLPKYFPDYKGQGYEIAGFAWFHGHKDTGLDSTASAYESNLVALIKDLRKEFDAPQAPFVVATVGFDGKDMKGHTLAVAKGQLAVSGETGNYPEFKGNVITMDTRPYWRTEKESQSKQGYHYHQNAETYLLVGDALARGMIRLKGEVSR